ncbi:hypothetical protein A3K29_01050 [Candidatus Collierbacteria bacterium RIFOXYB2_FULL_46_14]|uniref:Peptidase M23 n=1 Tax=Candidatus Collierbacteria bacterium GW2011_GWA2_46_26 TaxID=1618381 RepID=A0A0G1PKF0_9BACT|nr:MAG: Peptidase M23 [Candidatus Collierbacteria bacterium GW2011_GWC2_44_13]KKU33299.1 MAG: Peptidase M23 [Candidatus Collierbacteria bacterium GW2011_GWA2_46_26]OGD72718.1 MAG: hypothetical protein A3K29_01050 [Candidatus Collierbacteria bacterium RIFOXYB2_FULL_46_14]OGD75760.1 MAG: hypothetical protein A3K43_01050 [Candidatus Collierbacteria bacterium RIFOXYA2_FULL_46_20]OGD77096.1 MAG: hypothetical protein A3K39_01050 [Candidatus Collierbacteria bacterium RIFOXYC2_FULL_43_15]OGD80386.1 MA
MANHEQDIYDLGQVQKYFPKKLEDLSEQERAEALRLFSIGAGFYNQFFRKGSGHKVTPYTFQKEASPDEIQQIINYLSKEEEEETKKTKTPAKEESSVPPEIEGLVEEYRQNQERLNEEEVKSSGQRTVAEQVKIALSHSKIREQIMANRREREAAGEKFQDPNEVIVNLGDPKSQSINAVLSTTKKAIDSIAYTYPGFSSLSTSVQRQVINDAVDLSLAGIDDLDVAIQTASIQLGVDRIPSSYISEVARELSDIEKDSEELEESLSQNEYAIDSLKAKTTLSDSEQQQLNKLLKENNILTSGLNKASTRFIDFVDSQNERYGQYLAEKRDHLRTNPDLDELTLAANTKRDNLHENLLKNGVTPRGFSDLDKIAGLVTVIQKDIPGLHQYASYEGAQAAAIIGGGQGQAILAYSKGVTGGVLRQAEKYAAANPNSATAKFLANNTKVFQAARRSIREIENSKLGKDVLQAVSKGNQIIGIVTNPVGALKQWAGQKAGEQIAKRLVERFGSEALKNAANLLLKEGLKDGVKKLASQALSKVAIKVATWAALKLGISLTAESLNAIMPGLGVIVDIVVQAVIYIAEKTIGAGYQAMQSTAREIWGEELKPRDLLAPLAALGGLAVALFGTLKAAQRTAQIAVVSAAGIVIGSVSILLIYLSLAFLIAPMLSALVQLDSLEKVKYSEYAAPVTATNCSNVPWPFSDTHPITQGPRQTTTSCTHAGDIAESADFSVTVGTPILSIFSGKIDFAGWSDDGYGNNVKMTATTDTGTSFTVIYGHFSKVSVTTGSTVQVGAQLGLSGSTGYSTGPHLHLGYRGIEYNSCPAGNFRINENCCTTDTCNQP